MRDINYSSRKTIFGLCVAMFLWSLGAHAATLPPDPDNAALLYYQAFLLQPKPDAATFLMLNNVLRGAEPDEKIREYLNLKDCRDTIELAEAASEMSQCTWGIRYSQGLRPSSELMVQLRHLSRLLAVDALILAADVDYWAAFGRCLTIRRLADHIGYDTNITHAVSAQVDGIALRCIQHVLGSMPPDMDTLTWLQGQLAVQGSPRSPTRALEMELEFALHTMRLDPDTLEWFRDQLEGSAVDVQSLNDEELIALAREPYAKFLNSVLRIMGSDMTYEDTYAEIQRLTKTLWDEVCVDPATVKIMVFCGDAVIRSYGFHIRHIAYFNAIKAAIEIYLVIAKTGQLPETLPDYLPKDPYSGQDFEYEITEEGFVLRCRGEDLSESVCPLPRPGEDIDSCKFHQYEFKVQR